MTMGMVDTLMVGRLGPEAIGAVGRRQLAVHGHRDLRDGADARARRAGLAGVRRRRPRGLPSLAGARRGARAARCRRRSCSCCSGSAGRSGGWGLDADGARADPPVPRRADVERAAAAALLRVPPLPAGHGRGAADHDRARQRQHRQRGVQLDPDLRALRRAGHGGSRIGVGDRARARDDGGAAARRHRAARARAAVRGCSRPRCGSSRRGCAG